MLKNIRRCLLEVQPFILHRPEIDCYAASFRSPFATILSRTTGNGRCSFSASSGSADSHASNSAGVVSITGIAFAWINRSSVCRRRCH
jgi:hypothetical protein